jgi:hypothetical protein
MSYGQGSVILRQKSPASGPVTAGARNGLTITSGYVELGGTLIQETYVDTVGYIFTIGDVTGLGNNCLINIDDSTANKTITYRAGIKQIWEVGDPTATEAMRIVSTANLLLGTTVDSGYKLDISGSLRSTTGANFATTSGNVGIGGTNLTNKLETIVSSSNSEVSSSGIAISDGAANRTLLFMGVNTGNYAYIQANQDNVAAVNLVLQEAGANVLIGTTTNTTSGAFTNTKVGIKSAADGHAGGGLHIEAASNTNVAHFGFTGSAFRIGTSYRTSGSFQPIEFVTTGSSRLYIQTNGNIGIGTTTDAGYKLDVAGSLRTTTNAYFATTSGNVAIGTTSPSAQLHTTSTVRFANFGAGTATFDASGNLSSVSDERLKEVQGGYNGGLDEIHHIVPIVYKWNMQSGNETEHNYIGFSAQNIQEALGEIAIGVGKDGYLSIQDRAIIATLVNAVQTLANKIDYLENQLNILN